MNPLLTRQSDKVLSYILNMFSFHHYNATTQLGKWKNHSQSVDSTSPHGSHAGGKSSITSDSLDTGLGHHGGIIGSDPGLMESPKESSNSALDKSTTGNGVNGVNMTSIRKSSKKTSEKSIPMHVHLASAVEQDKKKESSWSEHTWSKYFLFRL